VEDALQVNSHVAIPLAEVVVRVSRSSGPGGQHANVTASRVEASFDVAASSALSDAQKARVAGRLGPVVRAVAQDARSQARNRELALERLRDRLERALHVQEPVTTIDPQRLAQEVAILADKADVTEELTRMAAHVAECKRLTDESSANGRRLDFLTQELNREVNTIGAKSQSAAVAARVVDAKAEVERLREQIQNVE